MITSRARSATMSNLDRKRRPYRHGERGSIETKEKRHTKLSREESCTRRRWKSRERKSYHSSSSSTARDQTYTFQGPGASNTTKIPREDPQEMEEERKLWRERGKKRENLAPHPSGLHPSGSHPSGPPFFWVWGPHPLEPHPSGPHPSGPHPSGRGLKGVPRAPPLSGWTRGVRGRGGGRGQLIPLNHVFTKKTRTIMFVPPLSLSRCLFFFAFYSSWFFFFHFLFFVVGPKD